MSGVGDPYKLRGHSMNCILKDQQNLDIEKLGKNIMKRRNKKNKVHESGGSTETK